MNEAQQAFLNGASTAYNDAAQFMRKMASDAPSELGAVGNVVRESFNLIAEAFENKAKAVVEEGEKIEALITGRIKHDA